MYIFVLMAVIALMPAGLGGERMRIGACVCEGETCSTVIFGAADFKTSETMCQQRKGDLMTIRSEHLNNVSAALLGTLRGAFWIGLRLPEGRCSNITHTLRGYEWTTGPPGTHFSNWRDNITVCSPRCVSVSNDLTWTERSCHDKIDGLLCEVDKNTCETPRMEALKTSDSGVIIYSDEGCPSAPCEHVCTAVPGGYVCACHHGYSPSREDPRLCDPYCASSTCPAVCDRNMGTAQCECPFGYIISEGFCLDIDECDVNACDQLCNNTFGSYICSCREGFSLNDVNRCVKAEGHDSFDVTTVSSDVTPGLNETNKVNLSNATSGAFLWLWNSVAVVVLVGLLVFVVRYCVIKHHGQCTPCTI